MKWRKRKQGAIPRNGIPIGNPIYIYMAGQTTGPYWLKLFEETHGYLGGTSGVTWNKKLELFLPQTSRATPGTSASIQYTSKQKNPNLFVSSHIYIPKEGLRWVQDDKHLLFFKKLKFQKKMFNIFL